MSSFEKLVGKTVKKIFMNPEFLKFETDDGNFCFGVEGDCCSNSYFYDFYGVKNLLENGKITEVKEVSLDSHELSYGDLIQCYGFQLTTEHPEFGPVTSVFSFRNHSNGYYGGWMHDVPDREVLPEITDDVIELVAD